ncbi:MAG: NmrA family NAD(P)-binding protein [Bacteroidota bacterium]
MKSTIVVVAGATGNLGGKIVQALLDKKADVRAVVRLGTSDQKVRDLELMGASVVEVDMQNVAAIAAACSNASCVVSALSGLRDVIIDTQKLLLDGALKAGVPRFIPSDFCLDFTPFEPGENRNLDWRREFHLYLDSAPIAATSIFNGAFMELLTGDMPLILYGQKRILFWGEKAHRMPFTTIADTAEYTANAAIDSTTPRYLRVAGDQRSPMEFKLIMTKITGNKFRLFRAGNKHVLSILIRIAKVFAPGKGELYPAFQGMQYMRNMIDNRSDLNDADSNRYHTQWTSISDYLQKYFTIAPE